MERRATGELESDVMEQLWRSDRALTPAEVQSRLPGDALAYTTIMTILTRLWRKGMVTRVRQGRAYAYQPVLAKADFLAERMRGELARMHDRKEVLSRFVDRLSIKDAEALRGLLEDLDGP